MQDEEIKSTLRTCKTVAVVIIQGMTEFIPVSSTAHLLIAQGDPWPAFE